MPRYQTDDTFGDCLEAKRAGTAALGLYYRCGMWSARYLTDGHIPPEVVADYGTPEWTRRLTDAGLFVIEEGGFWMPRYLDDNPSREQVLKQRALKAERQAKWLEKSRSSSSTQRRVSRPSNRPSPGTSRDGTRDAAPPLPSPKGEGVGAAPLRGAPPPPTQPPAPAPRTSPPVCGIHHQPHPCRTCIEDGKRAAAERALLDRLPEQRTEWQPTDLEFADARRVLNDSPRRDWALGQAHMELAAEGRDRPTFRELTMHAAALINDQTEGTP